MCIANDATPSFETIEETEYIFVEDSAWSPEAGLPLEREVSIASQLFEARMIRTDGSQIPYDRSEGMITISPLNGGEPIHIKLERFRSIEMRWINDRLLYVWMNLGRIYSVDAIFDAIAGQWIYRSGIVYETGL